MAGLLFKRSDEARALAFVFTSKLAPGAIIAQVLDLEAVPLASGVNAVQVNDAVVYQGIVQALFTLGCDGYNYKASCRIKDTNGQILEIVGLLAVRDNINAM